MLAVTLPQVLSRSMESARAFHLTSLLLVALAALCWLLFDRWAHQHRLAPQAMAREGFWRLLRHMPSVQKHFYAIYGLSMLASSLPAVLVLFFIRDRLGEEEKTGLFLLIYFLAGAASMPLWHRLSLRLGAVPSWSWGMLLAALSLLFALGLGRGDALAYGIICLFSGMALGSELALPPAILGQLVESQPHTATTHFAFMAFLLKLSLALATALGLPWLDAAGFVPKGVNSAAVLWQLSLAYALVPCLIKLACFVTLRRSLPLFLTRE